MGKIHFLYNGGCCHRFEVIEGGVVVGDQLRSVEEARNDYRELLDAGATKTPQEPPIGSWAATARFMAHQDRSGFDWDRWKDESKEW